MCKKIYLVLIVSLFSTSTIFAQDNIGEFLEAGVEDANTLVEGYVAPFMKGFGTGLGSGWLNTAEAHKNFGFDLTVTVNAAYVPDKDLFYQPNLINGGYAPGSPTQSPTIFGSDADSDIPTYEYSYEEDGETYTGTFDAPEGLNIKDAIGMQAIPVPMAQLGIGLFKKTDLKIRWTPEVDVEDGKFKLIGFGVMHDVKQHIPGIKRLPFDLSVFVGYTSLSFDMPIDEQYSGNGGGVNMPNGLGQFDVNTWTGQAIISKKFSVLTVYGGLGFNSVKSELALKGDYEVYDDSGSISVSGTDPIGLSFKTGGPKLNAGFRLKLAIITLHADYTVQKYDVLSVGFGFSVR